MAYNHGREDRKWRIWKEAEEKLLRECGVDEATIEQIRMADRADFNSNRRFYRWTNDIEQRNGRIIRQGNQNAEVEMSVMITEGSFDTYMWQTLQRKATFINQIMNAKTDGRQVEDIGGDSLSFTECRR
ncbi:hypothetical protein HMPREF9306_01610 [Propionimicrobium lymphophilum ACS-093-V-SCH5]|uniref:Helicase C-terminal domain-containing protein n=1 Tax=Propionimicrobium lymphophilum ACS-093-V-SCH5 TaxID=883161 RepID=S2VX14_9ACTN|nr:hypothetical protein HMPREF9306_01610 [Propionimicrobium lymphophilum ACS-093-V-SCH5]